MDKEYVVAKLPIFQRNSDGKIVELNLEIGDKILLSDAAADHLIFEGYVEEPKAKRKKHE